MFYIKWENEGVVPRGSTISIPSGYERLWSSCESNLPKLPISPSLNLSKSKALFGVRTSGSWLHKRISQKGWSFVWHVHHSRVCWVVIWVSIRDLVLTIGAFRMWLMYHEWKCTRYEDTFWKVSLTRYDYASVLDPLWLSHNVSRILEHQNAAEPAFCAISFAEMMEW